MPFCLFFISHLLLFCFFFFFFQAEDGIRDHCVTGVQTCALPISTDLTRGCSQLVPTAEQVAPDTGRRPSEGYDRQPLVRSEERRVGKECRSRWWRYH